MHLLANVDKLLEEWNRIRDVSVPVSITAEEAIKFANVKDHISILVNALQVSRLQNDSKAEQFYSQQFSESYKNFTKEYIFKVLRNV